jgi:hypothetical protein
VYHLKLEEEAALDLQVRTEALCRAAIASFPEPERLERKPGSTVYAPPHSHRLLDGRTVLEAVFQEDYTLEDTGLRARFYCMAETVEGQTVVTSAGFLLDKEAVKLVSEPSLVDNDWLRRMILADAGKRRSTRAAPHS